MRSSTGAVDDRSVRSMAVIWTSYMVFLGLYAWVAVDLAAGSRAGAAFFRSPLFHGLFAVLPAALVLLSPRALRGRMRWSSALFLRWSLAELPALTGLIGFLSGEGWGSLAGHLLGAAALFLWARPTAASRVGWDTALRSVDPPG